MDQSDVDYHDYLKLGSLLSLQHPRAPGHESDRTRSSEHFFIVVHQASELWLAQLLLDLDLASRSFTTAPDLTAEHLTRAAHVFSVLNTHVEALDQLSGDAFDRFRPYLGTASGAQSAQFAALEEALGFGPEPAPVIAALDAALDARGSTLTSACHPDSPLNAAVEALLDISRLYWRWKASHLTIVTRLVGDEPGTGGTTGVQYLTSRLRRPFLELLAAREQADLRLPVS